MVQVSCAARHQQDGVADPAGCRAVRCGAGDAARAAPLEVITLLAACDGGSAPAWQPSGTPSAAASAAPTPSPRAIGEVSGLTGQTNALSGTVSDFVVERTATETRVQFAADTLFEFDKATLSPAAQANLQRTA